jgi:hypothetical protein
MACKYRPLLGLQVKAAALHARTFFRRAAVPAELLSLEEHSILSTCIDTCGLQLGIQNEVTAFISLDGPEISAIPVNAEISFNWKFDGFGKQYCWIGEQLA